MSQRPTPSDVAERLALALNRAGLQRMTARVLAAFLFSDQESVTAGDLASQLGASSGSMSAAIGMLTTVGLIEQVPVPGSRRDHYRMRDNAWAILMTRQNAMLDLMQDVATEGLAATEPGSAAAHRLGQMRDFYAYMLTELPALVDRWHETRATSEPTTTKPSGAIP